MTVLKAVTVRVQDPNNKTHRLEALLNVDVYSESTDVRFAPETLEAVSRFMEMMPCGDLTVREVPYEGKPVGAEISQMARELQADQS
jgi:hypothetical protein